jgi:hypothetical protein
MAHSRAQLLVGELLVAAATTSFLVLAADRSVSPRKSERAEEFQRLVGGLGFGPAVDLARCAFTFDPRLCPDCPMQHGPIAGGAHFCPQHACSILYFPPLAPVAAVTAEEEVGGRLP